MVLHWRGRGWMVFVLPFAWLFAVIGVMIAVGFYEPDAHRAMVSTLRFMGLGIGLGAANLWLIFMFRRPDGPESDQFMWIAVRYWIWLIALGAAGTIAASFFLRP